MYKNNQHQLKTMHQKFLFFIILLSIFISSNLIRQLVSMPIENENDADQQANNENYDLVKESNLHFDFLPVNQKKISVFEGFISFLCSESGSMEYLDLCD